MQPTIICTAPVPGMIFLNGRFAGEASAERPLYAPVSPSGVVYLEYRPLLGAGGALSRRLVFSDGAPMADSLADAEGLCCVAWPSGALEIECTAPERALEPFTLEGLPCAIIREGGTQLCLDGLTFPLPRRAGRPALLRAPDAAALLGGIEGGGQYLATLSADLSAHTGTLVAERIELFGNGMLNARISLDDSVGHGRVEQWLLDGNGLNRLSSQDMWDDGAPRWPQSPEATLIAAVEAVLAGLGEEADGYMSAALAAARPLDAVGEICDACAPMRYGMPDGRPCAGLLKAENAHLMTVRPLYCRAEPSGGAQGPWRLTWIGEFRQ